LVNNVLRETFGDAGVDGSVATAVRSSGRARPSARRTVAAILDADSGVTLTRCAPGACFAPAAATAWHSASVPPTFSTI